MCSVPAGAYRHAAEQIRAGAGRGHGTWIARASFRCAVLQRSDPHPANGTLCRPTAGFADPFYAAPCANAISALSGVDLRRGQHHFPADYARFKVRDPGYAILDDGESLLQHCERVQACLLQIAADHPGQTVLIVTHGGVLDIVYRLATGLDMAARARFRHPQCGAELAQP